MKSSRFCGVLTKEVKPYTEYNTPRKRNERIKYIEARLYILADNPFEYEEEIDLLSEQLIVLYRELYLIEQRLLRVVEDWRDGEIMTIQLIWYYSGQEVPMTHIKGILLKNGYIQKRTNKKRYWVKIE